MLKGLKKLVSAFCATAMVMSLAVVPVMAAQDKVSWDYSVLSDETGWTQQNANISYSVADGGITINNVSTSGGRWARRTFDAVEGDVTVEYVVSFNPAGASSTMKVGDIVTLVVPQYAGASTKLNGTAIENMPSTSKTSPRTGKIKFVHTISGTSMSTVITKVDDDTEIYNDTASPYTLTSTTIDKFEFNTLGKSCGATLYTFNISVKDLPKITQSASSVVAGSEVEVASVTDAASTPTVEITGADADKFTYTVDEAAGTYSVKVTATDTAATSSYSADVKITAASADGSVDKTITLTASPLSEYISSLLAGLKLTGVAASNVTAVSGKTDEYNITGDFTAPVKDGDATVTWTPSTSALIATSDPTNPNVVLYKVNRSSKIDGATLKAKITYSGQDSDERVFTLNIVPENPDVPTIKTEDAEGMEARVNKTIKLATVKNYQDINVTVSDSNFTTTKKDGVIELKVNSEPSDTTNVKVDITAIGNEGNTTASFTIKAVPTSKYPELIAKDIDIENGSSVVKNGSVYDITSDFTVPVTGTYDYALDDAVISWTSSTDAISFDAGGSAVVDANSSTGTVTATVTYAGNTYSKNFSVKLADHKYIKYYDESFDGSEFDGTLVNLKNGETTVNNILFKCGTRSNGGTDEISIKVTMSDSNKYITTAATNYNTDRQPYFTLTNCSGTAVANRIYNAFDFYITTQSIVITDTANNTLTITVGDPYKADTWYTAEIISDGTSATMVVYDKSTGSIVSQSEVTFGILKTVSGVNNSNSINFAIDNLKVMDLKAVKITPDVPEKLNATGDDNWVSVGTYDADMANSVAVTSSNANIEAKAEGGKILVHALTDNVETSTIEVTAKADIETKSKFSVTSASNESFVDKAAAALTIVDNDKVLSGLGGTSVVLSDFAAPSTVEGATVAWSVDDADADYVKVNGSRIVIYPDSTLDKNIPLTATVTYGDTSKTKVFTLDLSNYKNNIIEAVDAYANTVNTFTYAKDANGNYFKTTLADGVQVFSDIYVPASTVAYKDYRLTIAYEFTGAIGEDGKISVSSPTEEKDATIKKTVSYIKNGTTLYTKEIENTENADSNEFAVKVKFNPADVEPMVEAAVYAANETTADAASDEVKAELAEAVKSFVSEPAVTLDAANIENFYAKVGTSATEAELPASLTLGFTVKTEGVFGSKIAWTSGNSSRIAISAAGVGVVTQGTQNAQAKLTAIVSYGDGDAKYQAGEAYTKTITVPAKNTGTVGGGGGGGGGNTGTLATGTTSSVPASQTSQYMPNANPSGFTDLDSVDWAKTAINNLYVNGIISGKAENLFYPNDNITRAEFAKILVNAFNLPTSSVGSATFYDVKTDHWASEYVEAAFKAGVIKGFDDGSFEPNTNVTRQDMAVMVLRAAEAAGRTFAEKKEAQTFGDEATIAAYAKTAITTLQKAGVVNGVENGNFAPLSTSTRAQACQIIYNVIK